MEAIVYISGVIKHVDKSVAFMQCSVILEQNRYWKKTDRCSSAKDAMQSFYHILSILGNIKANEFGTL